MEENRSGNVQKKQDWACHKNKADMLDENELGKIIYDYINYTVWESF